MTAPAAHQCGSVCEMHWFDTAPVHIQQPPMTVVDDEMLKRRRIEWVKEGIGQSGCIIAPDNPRAALFIFMQDRSRTEIRQIATVIATNGDPDALEYPCGYLVETLRRLDADTAAEAWDLFGRGVKP